MQPQIQKSLVEIPLLRIFSSGTKYWKIRSLYGSCCFSYLLKKIELRDRYNMKLSIHLTEEVVLKKRSAIFEEKLRVQKHIINQHYINKLFKPIFKPT